MSAVPWTQRAVALFLLATFLGMGGCGASTKQPPSPALQDGLPHEARELLAKSAADSCSICAQEFRRKAYRVLEDAFPAGTIVLTDSTTALLRIPESPNELYLAKIARATEDLLGGDHLSGTRDHDPSPTLSFRFHTPSAHLVGISPSDMTDAGIADVLSNAPRGTKFEGVLQVVPFAYGEGSTFLDNTATDRIEVQCKVLDIHQK